MRRPDIPCSGDRLIFATPNSGRGRNGGISPNQILRHHLWSLTTHADSFSSPTVSTSSPTPTFRRSWVRSCSPKYSPQLPAIRPGSGDLLRPNHHQPSPISVSKFCVLRRLAEFKAKRWNQTCLSYLLSLRAWPSECGIFREVGVSLLGSFYLSWQCIKR